MLFDKNVKIIIKFDYILVYLNNELFFKQKIIKKTSDNNKNIDYTLFFVYLILQKFGLVWFS